MKRIISLSLLPFKLTIYEGLGYQSAIKDEYDHIIDWVIWANKDATKIIEDFRKTLEPILGRPTYNSEPECQNGAVDLVNAKLRTSAGRQNQATVNQYDNKDKHGDNTPHHYPHKSNYRGKTPHDKLKPFPFNLPIPQ